MGASDRSPCDARIRLVRPLMEIDREAIAQYARARRIRFRTDRTNTDVRHLRNRVRHELLPLLRERYQPAIARVLCRTATILSAEADCLEALASGWLQGGGEPFDQLPLAIRRLVVQRQALELGVAIEFDEVEQLVAAAGRRVNAPGGQHLLRTPGGRLRLMKPVRLSSSGRQVSVELATRGSVRFGGCRVDWCLTRTRGVGRMRRLEGREQFDADRVGGRIVLRHWRAGDRFQPIGMDSPVKLQDLFVNLKVPRIERVRRLVGVAESGEVFWVQGLRIGERFKLEEGTRRRLVWRWKCS